MNRAATDLQLCSGKSLIHEQFAALGGGAILAAQTGKWSAHSADRAVIEVPPAIGRDGLLRVQRPLVGSHVDGELNLATLSAEIPGNLLRGVRVPVEVGHVGGKQGVVAHILAQ